MEHFAASTRTLRLPLDGFLDSHYGRPRRDDVGPMLAQAASIRDTVSPDDGLHEAWHRAVSAAVSA